MQTYKGSFKCAGCNEDFQATYMGEKPNTCPNCGSKSIKCISETPQSASQGSCGGCGCGSH